MMLLKGISASSESVNDSVSASRSNAGLGASSARSSFSIPVQGLGKRQYDALGAEVRITGQTTEHRTFDAEGQLLGTTIQAVLQLAS